MPNPYSLDLRVRAVELASRKNMSVVSAAKLLKIGKSTLYRYLKQENEHGHLNPKENFKNGHSHKFKNLKKFERIASKNKSLTCPELAEKIGGISARTVSRYRHKIGYTRKKRPTQIRSKTRKNAKNFVIWSEE